MKVLSIGSDRKLLEHDSPVRERIILHGELFNSLSVILFSLGERQVNGLSNRVTVYTTGSFSKFLYVWDAVRVGKQLPKPDVITAQDPFLAGMAANILGKYFKVPVQIQVHTDICSSQFKNSSFYNRVRLFISKKVLSDATGVRVVSNKIKESLVKKFNISEKIITVLPVYIDIKKQNTSKKIDDEPAPFKKVILVVSRLTREKNINLALFGFAYAKEELPNVGMVIVGDGPLRSELETTAKKLGISERVIFVGWKNDTSTYYKNADVLLVTSLYEGYGLVFVEAAIYGIPVLSTDVGIAREVGAEIVHSTPKEVALGLAKILKENQGVPATLPDLYNQSQADYLESYKKALSSLL